jgi:hypothetical protein
LAELRGLRFLRRPYVQTRGRASAWLLRVGPPRGATRALCRLAPVRVHRRSWGIDIWQVIDLDSEVVSYAHPSESIAVLDDRGLERPDRHPEHQPAPSDQEGVASAEVFAE